MDKRLKKILKSFNLSESTISTILGALVVIIVGVLIFNYFKQTSQQTEEITPKSASDEIVFEENESGESIPVNLPDKHIVASGEDLWKIAEKYYQSGYNWVDIAKANNLSNPNLLLVNQELILPKVPVKKVAESEQKVLAQTSSVVSEDNAITGTVYTIKKGDNLWSICVRAYADGYKWPEIAKINNLANPDYLEVGKELKLPR